MHSLTRNKIIKLKSKNINKIFIFISYYQTSNMNKKINFLFLFFINNKNMF